MLIPLPRGSERLKASWGQRVHAEADHQGLMPVSRSVCRCRDCPIRQATRCDRCRIEAAICRVRHVGTLHSQLATNRASIITLAATWC